MTKLSVIACVAITLALPLRAVGHEKPANPLPKSSSFVPHPHTRQHGGHRAE